MSQTEVQLIKNGAVVDADINGMSSSKLSGALPAISGASLTNLPTPTGKVRNLIINGAMQVAQRGSASSTTQGLATVDRFKKIGSGLGNTFSQEQITLSSSDTPYSSGFRKAFRVSQNQAGTANAAGATDAVVAVVISGAADVADAGAGGGVDEVPRGVAVHGAGRGG